METFFNDLIGAGLIKAIYLTLFHSLWQGALIAAIVGIIMMATKKASSAWRYNLLLSSLLLFAICALCTFVTQAGSGITNKQLLVVSSNEVIAGKLIDKPFVENNLKTFTDEIVAFCNDHADAIVIFWFLVICFKCVQLFIGLSGTTALRKRLIFPADPYWENRLKELSEQLGINQYIKIAESGLAKVPLTIGYLKPVILIPLGLLAALPQDQIEAILLHELAHIRRKDYLINILQSLVEILFFFNPAIWWLSSLLRTERENCCDDLAIAKTSNKFNYIKALVAFEEYQGQMPQYASAITGSKNQLLNRAKRLIYNHNKTLNPMEKIILTCGLAITGMLTLAFTQVEKHILQKHQTAPIASVAENKSLKSENTVFFQDTAKKITPRKTSNISVDRDGKRYRIMIENDKITQLYVDKMRIADDKIEDYKSITDNILADTEKREVLAKDSKVLAENSKKLAAESKNLAERISIKEADETKAMAKEEKELSEQSKLYAIDSKEEKTRVKMEVKKLDEQIEKLNIQKQKLEKTEKPEKLDEKERKLNRVEYIPGSINLSDRSVPTPRVPKEPMPYKPSQNGNQRIAPLKPIESFNYNVDSTSNKRVRPLRTTNSFSQDAVAELMRLGIIKDNHVKFTINNDELIVNGVKQSEEVHQKILSKMSNKPSGKIEFSYNHE
jgi:bla regulator protein BlaR1